MADESVSQNFSENPDPQEKPVSEDDITPSQGQQPLPDKLPQSLIKWLECIVPLKETKTPGVSPGDFVCGEAGWPPAVWSWSDYIPAFSNAPATMAWASLKICWKWSGPRNLSA
jgi:hypothetical protein